MKIKIVLMINILKLVSKKEKKGYKKLVFRQNLIFLNCVFHHLINWLRWYDAGRPETINGSSINITDNTSQCIFVMYIEII